jgi:aminopeptidase N
VRVDDPSALPLSNAATADPNDTVIGVDFSGGPAAVAAQLNAALSASYQRLVEAGSYDPHAASAGRRALRNTCLDLLAATAEPHVIQLAHAQYQAASNMTDRVAALATLAQHDVPQRQAAFDDFYQRYQGDPLVLDKWFALQATMPDTTTLDRVRALTSHPAFAMSNPNRVRALIGAFAQMNQKEFNRADGAGYEFLAEKLLALDASNPQVAARLATAFRSWRTLEPDRRAHAKRALQTIAAAATLSNDLRDIVARALAD